MIIRSTSLHSSPLYSSPSPNTIITFVGPFHLSLSPCWNLESQSSTPPSLSQLLQPLNPIFSHIPLASFISLYLSNTMIMKTQQDQQKNLILQRSTSASATITRNNRRIIPSNNHHQALFRSASESDDVSDKLLVRRGSSPSVSSFSFQQPKPTKKLSSLIRSFLNIFTFQTITPTCKWLTIPSTLSNSMTPSLGRKVTGTLFGHRRGHISFAVQLDPRSEPLLLLELAMSTSSLVKEMSSGLVRIALECRKTQAAAHGGGRHRRLFHEPAWTMYCNGRKCGYAASRTCGELDWHVLSTVQSVSVGAGVIPVLEDGGGGAGSEGELMYMRARFERVVGSRDSEAFYMLNPDGNGGPELSIFLLRI